MPKRHGLVVVLMRPLGDKIIMDSFVYDMDSKSDRKAAMRCILSAYWGGFRILLFPV